MVAEAWMLFDHPSANSPGAASVAKVCREASVDFTALDAKPR